MIPAILSPLARPRLSRWWAILLSTLLAPVTVTASGAEIVVVDGSTTVRRDGRDRKGGVGNGSSALENGGFSVGLDGWDSSEFGGGAAPGGTAAEDGAAVSSTTGPGDPSTATT